MFSSASTAALPLPAIGQVQVWLLDEVELTNAAADLFAGWLSDEERERWQRFRHADDRQCFLQARALVRSVLARYCDCDPAALRFGRDTHGKPYLLTQDARFSSLRFNLSHTRGLCALAVTMAGEVGVDVESQIRAADMLALAQRFFAPQEADLLQALPAAELRAAFFRLWTLKEAYVKARGLGLQLGLDSFAFSCAGTPVLLSGDDASRWSFAALMHAPHFHVAVAVHAPGATIQLHSAELVK